MSDTRVDLTLTSSTLYGILHTSISLVEYTNIAEKLIPTALPLDSVANAVLFVAALKENSFEKFKLLLSLGVPLVNVSKESLMTSPGIASVMAPELKVSEDIAKLYAQTIIGMQPGKELHILKKEVASLTQRLNLFQCIQEPALLASLYIHLGVIHPGVTQRDTILVLCGRANLFVPGDTARVKELIRREDELLQKLKLPCSNNEKAEKCDCSALLRDQIEKLNTLLTQTKGYLKVSESNVADLKDQNRRANDAYQTEYQGLTEELSLVRKQLKTYKDAFDVLSKAVSDY